MNLIAIFDDGIKISYSFIALIITMAIGLSFMNIKKERKYIHAANEELRCHSDYKMTICVRQGKFNNKLVKLLLH